MTSLSGTTQATLPTQFAPAARASREALTDQSRLLEASPFVVDLLDSFPEPVVLLNPERQIVLANDKLAALLNKPRSAVVGFRPGEVFGCIHSGESAGGCGTTVFCSECGAVAAILESQKTGEKAVQECRLKRRPGTEPEDLDLRIWATPLVAWGREFTVFAIRDTTDEKRRLVLERMFFHDLLNAAGGLQGLLKLWPLFTGPELAEAERTAEQLSDQIVEEIQSQRDLAAAERGELRARPVKVDAAEVVGRLCIEYSRHPVSEGKTILPPEVEGETSFVTDPALLHRVLGNLVKNAVEASAPGEPVSVAFTGANGSRVFRVKNVAVMPQPVQLQMFQRSFSTKAPTGRGIGAYSVRLLTERYLKGNVSFRSEEGLGTVFSVSLPEAIATV